MCCVKQKNLISLVERLTQNRFCDRNSLKTGHNFCSKKSAHGCPNFPSPGASVERARVAITADPKKGAWRC